MRAASQGPAPRQTDMTARTPSRAANSSSAATGAAARVTRHEIASGDRAIAVHVCYPAGYPSAWGAHPLPWLLYLHAGGFVDGGVERAARLTQSLAAAVPAVVVAPEYSLAPDHPFPAAPEDAFNTTEWVLRNGRKLKVDKHRFALVGEEAGGNLAIAVAQMLRDRGLPAPVAQWLIRPVTDPCLQHASCGGAGKVPLETLQRLAGYYREYLPTPAASVHPYAAPAHAMRLAGLPATLIQVAEADALRPEGEAFGRKLAACGVATETQIMAGACGAGVEASHDRCQVWVEEGARYLRARLAAGDDASPQAERHPVDKPADMAP
ncbi:acetyl esterase/lipase [Cupriavidus gilardii J11]|uniref:Acetyl esterase/lipase n=1 Tax=Cupriavidus gilardii J11 TaxID=936133 RepID=A0A562BQ19_9BURK|nr:acetyl esterase/lipase [Cupriavidus gilardii J11]